MKQLAIPGTRKHSGRTFPRLHGDEALRQYAREQRKAAMALTTTTVSEQLADVQRQLGETRERIRALDEQAKAFTEAKLAERNDLIRAYLRLEGAVVALSTALAVPIDMGAVPTEPLPVAEDAAPSNVVEIVRG